MNEKLPLIHKYRLFIYLFLLQYFTCNSAEPDTGTEKVRAKKRQKEMIGEDNEKQDGTK